MAYINLSFCFCQFNLLKCGAMATLAEAEKVLHQYFGFEHFRPSQIPIIEAVLSERDVLALLPTGGGKSLCFQVPGLLRGGVTLVISPLIALMSDQVSHLKKHAITAECWHSQLSETELTAIQLKLAHQKLKFLYLSPEKLWSHQVKKLLNQYKINSVAIDEAHCISLWGHDFRPLYVKIKDWLTTLKKRPQVIALTATATTTVQKEISEFLDLQRPIVINQSAVRNNLAIQVLLRNSPTKKLISILTLLEYYENQTVILYCSTRGEVEQLWQTLQLLLPDTKIFKYHGGLDKTQRKTTQNSFLTTSAAILVATNAFGMGIDKPDIRLIIHTQLPSNLENYAQEIGRAGRDGELSAAVLLVSDTDWDIQLSLASRQPNHLYKMRYLKYFVETQRCRMSMLSEYFGEPFSNCGTCDVCTGNLELQPSPHTQKIFQALTKLKIPYRQTLKLIALTKPKNLKVLPGIGQGWIAQWGQKVLAQLNMRC